MSEDRDLKAIINRLLSETKIKFSLADSFTADEDRYFPEYQLGAIKIIINTQAYMIQIISESDLYDDAALFMAKEVKRTFAVKYLFLRLHNPAKAAEAAIEQTSTIAQT